MMTFSKSEHQLEAYSELAFHPSEEIHCTDISPLVEVIPCGATTETMLYGLSELHGSSKSKLCLLDV